MNIRSGYYGNYMGEDYKIYGSSSGWIISMKDVKDIKLTNKEAKNNIKSAYSVTTFCNYKSGKYSIDFISEEEVALNPDINTLTKVLGKHPYEHGVYKLEISYNEFLANVSTIWEERKKISGFPFKEEKVAYLKTDI